MPLESLAYLDLGDHSNQEAAQVRECHMSTSQDNVYDLEHTGAFDGMAASVRRHNQQQPMVGATATTLCRSDARSYVEDDPATIFSAIPGFGIDGRSRNHTSPSDLRLRPQLFSPRIMPQMYTSYQHDDSPPDFQHQDNFRSTFQSVNPAYNYSDQYRTTPYNSQSNYPDRRDLVTSTSGVRMASDSTEAESRARPSFQPPRLHPPSHGHNVTLGADTRMKRLRQQRRHADA